MVVLVAVLVLGGGGLLPAPFLSDCDPLPRMAVACHRVPPRPDTNALPILATWYNPALGGINCAASCDVLADGLGWGIDDYGRVAACPQGWHYDRLRFGSHDVLCRDRGGMINCSYNDFFRRWVCHVDIMANDGIDCNYCLYWDWKRVRK